MDALQEQLDKMIKDHGDFSSIGESNLKEGMATLQKEGTKEQLDFVNQIISNARKGIVPNSANFIKTFEDLNI